MPVVLNLVISGIPSIQNIGSVNTEWFISFKPCYKWNTFNTLGVIVIIKGAESFKPCYKWNTFNTHNVEWSTIMDPLF